MLPDCPRELSALHRADSVALDPHKWLYNPIEAACILVRDPAALRDAFSYKPPYYQLGADPPEAATDFYEHGLQNTRGFRALKTWLCIQQTGRRGYMHRIGEDIDLARYLYDQADKHPELEAGTCHLSIATFRYGPDGMIGALADEQIDEINLHILERVNASGEAFVSNAVLQGRQYLRACVVNFRTRREHIDHLIDLVVSAGREVTRA
jgi:glutamate/tyrosine decarboxylase-like PLP-dependent enzyme